MPVRTSWRRPPLRTTQARKDFRDLVELCGLEGGTYEVVADDDGVAVEPAGGLPPRAAELLDRAYALVADDRPVQEVVRYECDTAPPPPDPPARTPFVPAAPGLFAGGPPVAELLRRLDDLFLSLAREADAAEYAVPHLIPWAALSRAGYVAAFPQHLTACSSVRRDLDAVDELSRAPAAADAAPLMQPQDVCLAPAACYHLYPLLAGTTIEPAAVFTVVAPCSRRELRWTPEPIRLWSFRMREIVHIGPAEDCVRFRDRQLDLVADLARRLELPCRLVSANDPFYTSARTGQVGVQNLLGLKYELVSRDADGNEFATSSVNLHRDHLGRAFDLRSAGRPAHTTCIGFGLERWAHWILSHCGVRPSDWPAPLRRPAADRERATA
jgi:seryl-tRNA synthetase